MIYFLRTTVIYSSLRVMYSDMFKSFSLNCSFHLAMRSFGLMLSYCSHVYSHLFRDVVKSQKVAGQRPRQGTKSCRMGKNFIHPSAHLSARPLFHWSTRPLSKGSEGLPKCSEGLLEGSEGLPEGYEGLSEGSE